MKLTDKTAMNKMLKNLMLVAVAAMAFVGCSQDIAEVNVVDKGIVFDISAGINEDTRAYFGDVKDGIYPVILEGNEYVRFEAQGLYSDGSTGPYGHESVVMTVDTETNRAMFRVKFWDESVLVPGTIKAYMGDAMNWNGELMLNGYTQTPELNSIDRNYFALKAEFQWDGVNTTLSGDFMHLTAYAKMTVDGIDADIKTILVTDDANNYTLNVEGLDTKTFWFAVAPDENVQNLMVKVITVDGDVYDKVYTLDNKLAFNAGRISNFSVKGFEKAAEYTLQGNYLSYDGNFMINVYDAQGNRTLTLNTQNVNATTPLLPVGTYSTSDNTLYGYDSNYNYFSNATMTVEHLEKGYHITVEYESNGEVFTLDYSGYVERGDEFFLNPGDPMPLQTPVVESNVSNYNITLSWVAVNGAKDYTISWNYGDNSTTVEGTTFTMTGTPFTNYRFEVVANASGEGVADSMAAIVEVSLGIAKDAKGTVETVFDVMEDLGNNRYKFYVKNTTGTEYSDRDFMYIKFNSPLAAGVYTIDDIDGNGSSLFSIGAGREPEGYVGYYDSNYANPVVWMYYGQNICIYVDEVNGSFSVTAFVMHDYYFGAGNIFKGIYVPSLKTALDTPVVSEPVVDGNSVTINWDDVQNAANYIVTYGNNSDTVSDSEIILSDLDWNTTYEVSIVAMPADTTKYTESEAAIVEVEIGAEPQDPGTGDSVVVKDPWNFTASLNSYVFGKLNLSLNGNDGVSISIRVNYNGYTALGQEYEVVDGSDGVAGTVDSVAIVVDDTTTDANNVSGTVSWSNNGDLQVDITADNVRYVGSVNYNPF